MFPQVSTVHSALHVMMWVFFPPLHTLAHDRGNREDMHVSNVCVCVCSVAGEPLLTRNFKGSGAWSYNVRPLVSLECKRNH